MTCWAAACDVDDAGEEARQRSRGGGAKRRVRHNRNQSRIMCRGGGVGACVCRRYNAALRDRRQPGRARRREGRARVQVDECAGDSDCRDGDGGEVLPEGDGRVWRVNGGWCE